jgi:hypothetical protein
MNNENIISKWLSYKISTRSVEGLCATDNCPFMDLHENFTYCRSTWLKIVNSLQFSSTKFQKMCQTIYGMQGNLCEWFT